MASIQMLQFWMVDTDAGVLDGRYRCCSVGWVRREKDGCKTYADRWIKIWYIEEEIRRKNRSRKRDNRHKTQNTKHKTQDTARNSKTGGRRKERRDTPGGTSPSSSPSPPQES